MLMLQRPVTLNDAYTQVLNFNMIESQVNFTNQTSVFQNPFKNNSQNSNNNQHRPTNSPYFNPQRPLPIIPEYQPFPANLFLSNPDLYNDTTLPMPRSLDNKRNLVFHKTNPLSKMPRSQCQSQQLDHLESNNTGNHRLDTQISSKARVLETLCPRNFLM